LALSLHPDRAGAESKAAFQRVAEAYAVLSDPEARACHDRAQRAREAGAAVHTPGEIARAGDPSSASPPSSLSPKVSLALRLDAAGRLLTRLSTSLASLVAREDARHDGDVIELYLQESERRTGGVALIDVELRVRCSLCGGIARPGGFWCFRCQQTGESRETVTVYCAVQAQAREGSLIVISTHEAGGLADLKFRIRQKSARGASVG
jgi:DnaJ-class molecular chaperone